MLVSSTFGETGDCCMFVQSWLPVRRPFTKSKIMAIPLDNCHRNKKNYHQILPLI